MKIAIVGTAPTSKMLAPFADESWEIWACSAGNVDQLPRVSIWFELHAIVEMMAPENRAMAEPFFNWLKTKSEAGNFQVVMLEAGSDSGGKTNTFVPKAIPYPRDEMIGLFGRNWFTSSVAYMMALAIARGATEIGLFGVDMAADQEHYSAQRAGCTRFIEIAEERGIKVHVPFESCLKTAPPMYGYWEGTPFGRRINSVMVQVQTALNQKVAQRAALDNEIQYFSGAMEQLRYFQRTWVDGAEIEMDLGNFPAMLKAQQEQDALKARQAAVAPFPLDTTFTSGPITPRPSPAIGENGPEAIVPLDIIGEIEAALAPAAERGADDDMAGRQLVASLDDYVPLGMRPNGHAPAAPESDA